MVPAPTLKQQLAALARKHGVSVERVINTAYDPNVRGTSPTFVKKVLAGERRPNRQMLEALADALGEPPTVFTAYRLISLRDALDAEDYARAVATLELIERALSARTSDLIPDEGEFPLGPLRQLLEEHLPTRDPAPPRQRGRAADRRRRTA